jgi:glycosyltransferase involved in cell wall biosynthesis
MRVIVNGVSALKPKTGVGHTTVYLHKALCETSPGDSFWLYPGATMTAASRRLLHKPGASGGAKSAPHQGKSRVTNLAKAAYREHFRLAARWGDFDLYHEPNFVPIRTHLPTIVTVHDLSVILHPEWHPAERVAMHEKCFHRGIATAAHIIVVSEAVRQEMIDVLGVLPGRVTAIHNGIGDQYLGAGPTCGASMSDPRRDARLPERYLLTVGTIEPRKNLLTIMRAYCDLPAQERSACRLVIVGGWGWKSEAERAFFEHEARHRGVVHFGYASDAELPALYAGATALLYPSFYEGFGLPPVEMLAGGGAVIASTAAAVREVVGRHALLLDPLDFEGWRDAMSRIIREPGCLDECRRGGIQHARQFTWSRAANRTLGVYRTVLEAKNNSHAEARRAA